MRWDFWRHEHTAEIVDVQHCSLQRPSLMGPAGEPEPFTLVLVRCKTCGSAHSEKLLGTWSIEQLRDGKSLGRTIDDLVAHKERP